MLIAGNLHRPDDRWQNLEQNYIHLVIDLPAAQNFISELKVVHGNVLGL
jgi:hypothetical protein